MIEDGELGKGYFVLYGSLGMTIAGLAQVLFYAQPSAPKHIILGPNHASIPARWFSTKIVKLRYAEIVKIEKAERYMQPVLLIIHRDGRLHVPFALLQNTNIEALLLDLKKRTTSGILSPLSKL